MAGAGLGLMCVIIVIALPIGLCIGALILMAAVWLANKCLGQERSRSYYDDDDDDYDWDRPRRRRRRGRSAIPEPNFGHAVVIVFVSWIVSFGIGFVMGFVAGAGGMRGQNGMLALQACSVVINFAVAATVNSQMLPTTFPRACLVVLFQFLIGLAIAIVLILPIFLLAGGMRAFR